MKMTLRITPLTLLLAACGGMQAGAQPQVAKGADRLHVYEVAPDIAAQAAQEGFIEVSGTGSVSVESDLAHVSFALETRRPSAAETASGNATFREAVGLMQYRDFTPIEPTEQTVSSTVTVRFALGPEISRR